MDIQSFLMWAAGIIIGAIFSLVGWVFKRVFKQMEKVEEQTAKVEKNLHDHKLHAAETFATKKDVDRGFDRVMDKLESMDEKADENTRILHLKIDSKADKQ